MVNLTELDDRPPRLLQLFPERELVRKVVALASWVMLAMMTQYFVNAADNLMVGRLPAGDAAACAPLPAVGEVAPLQAAQERRLPFDSAQAHVLIGQPGYKRDDPDYFALLVGNYTLGGGGFVSRLTQEVREKRGLAYEDLSPYLEASNWNATNFTVRETRNILRRLGHFDRLALIGPGLQPTIDEGRRPVACTKDKDRGNSLVGHSPKGGI